MAGGVETWLQLRDGDDMDESRRLGFGNVTALTTPANLPPLEDDPWTAFLLAFHDMDWEESLLAQALSGPAFYIGAVGSRRTHARRCDQLRRAGFGEDQVRRIYGPAGIIPSMRDASTLAISVLAEIVEAFHHQAFSVPSIQPVEPCSCFSHSFGVAGRSMMGGDEMVVHADSTYSGAYRDGPGPTGIGIKAD
ncbi:MAG: XdhC family protein [bacterium]